MKKFISMLLVTAFMLVAFSALGTPVQADGGILWPIPAITPYYELTVSLSGSDVFQLSIEESGSYIIQTFGFVAGNWPQYNGYGAMNLSMTLKDSSHQVVETALQHSGYGSGCFMCVDLSANQTYTLEVESMEADSARISLTLADYCFDQTRGNGQFYETLYHFNVDDGPVIFTFDRANEYMALVCVFEGSGGYEVQVSGCGYEQAYLIDPRPNSHGEELEERFVLLDCTETGYNWGVLEEGVEYYFVLFFNRSDYSILSHLDVEEIDVEVFFYPNN